MFRSVILSFSVLSFLGAAMPTMLAGEGSTNSRTPARASWGRSTFDPRDSNNTKQFATENFFPDPETKCSGRQLDDEGDSNWSSDLEKAVTASSSSGIYGTCEVNNDEVDGEGVLGWKSGTVQAYYCNHGFTPNPCSVNEYWRADDLIKSKCGDKGGGWVHIKDWGKTIGRDPTNSDGSFRDECGSSLHSAKANFIISNVTQAR